MFWVIIYLLLILFIAWVSLNYYRALKIKGNLPGPTIYPFFLNDLQIIAYAQKDKLIEQYYSTYGDTFMIVSNFFVLIFTVDPNNIQHITSENHNFKNYKRTLRTGMIHTVGHILFGDGIFFTDGIVWEVQRFHSNPMFKRENIIDMLPIFERKTKQIMEQLKSLDHKEPIDMQDIYMRYTLDSFGEIGFGVALNLISQNVEFPRWFDRVQRLLIELVRSPINRILKMNDYKNLVNQLDKVVYDIIDQKKKSDYENKKDLLSQFMSLRDSDGKPYPDKWIRDIIINFMIAGRDTTATLLIWTTYLLASHPHVLEELVKEVSPLKGTTLTFDNISQLHYLDNVIKESLRLYSPVPGVARFAEKDDILPDGTPVKAGTRVKYHSYYVQRHPKYWDDPLSFLPDRWNNQSAIIKNSYQYLPFHGGPMSCIGRKMAVLEAKCMIILLLQNFGIAPLSTHKYNPLGGIINNCEGGCPIFLKTLNE